LEAALGHIQPQRKWKVFLQVNFSMGGKDMKSKFLIILSIIAISLMAAPAMANTTITATVNGQPTSSSVDFAFSTDQVVVTLNNLIPNIKNVGQGISDFGFVLHGITANATLGTNTGMERIVANNLSYQDLGSATTGWSLTSGFNFALLDNKFTSSQGTVGIGYYLNVLGTPIAPAHLIIGDHSADNLYDNANGSIAGNNPHNPFLFGPVSFTLSIPGVTSGTTVDYVLFSYGTTPSSVVPIPPSVLLLGSGLLGLGLVGWRRREKKA
jgi:hypothetical protein